MTTGLRERLEWDPIQGTLRDRDIPYVMIRPDSLMGIFRFLEKEAQPAALAAFIESVSFHGAQSAESYQALGANAPGTLLKTFEETASQLGWGKWEFSRQGVNMLKLGVWNSPFAAGFGESEVPVCAAITGIINAVGSLVLDGPVEAREIECVSVGATHCSFEVSGTTP